MNRPTTLSDGSGGLLTCVLITGSDASHAIAGQLRSWSDEGLLLPFVVVEMDDVHGLGGRAPVIRGRFVAGAQKPAGCDVLRLVAEGGWRRVLLLTLIDVHAEAAQVSEPQLVGAAVAEELRTAMPMESSLTRLGPRRLTAVRMFVPASDSPPFPARWADYDEIWEHSLVLSPEDRQEPDSIADHVRFPGNYASHAAGAVAAIGGLWFGFGQPGLPVPARAEEGSKQPEASVQVIRVQNRVAAASTPLGPVTRQAIAVAEGRDNAPEGSRYGLRRVNQATSRVLCRRGYQAVRDHESRTLHYQPLPIAARPGDVEIGPTELFNNYWRFVFGHRRKEKRAKGQFFGALWEPIQRPWIALRRWIDRTLHRALQGDDTGRRFRTSPALPYEMALAWTRRWQQASGGPRRVDASFDPEADAVFWGTLRDWTLGLVDGQRPDVDPQRLEVVDVVTDRSLIAAGPVIDIISDETSYLLSSERDVSPFDVSAVAGLHDEVAAVLQERAAAASQSPAPPPEQLSASDPASGALPYPTAWIVVGGLTALLGAFALGAGSMGWGAVLITAGAIAALIGAGGQRAQRRAERASGTPSAADLPLPPGVFDIAAPDGPLSGPRIDRSLLEDADVEVLDKLEEDRALISYWLEKYRSTLLGRLSSDIAADIGRARHESHAYRKAFDDIEHPDFSLLSRRRKAWLWWFWICLFGWAAGMYGIWRWYSPLSGTDIQFPFGWFVPSERIAAVFVGLLSTTAVALFARALIGYYKAFQQARHQLRIHAEQCVSLVRKRDHAESEALRLQHINDRFTRWSEVYAWVLLDPYPDDEAAAAPQPEDDAWRPAATDVPAPGNDAGDPVQIPEASSAEVPESADEDDLNGTVPPAAPPDAQAVGQVARADEDEAADHGRPPLSTALGTQIGTIAITAEFADAELRSAVSAAASRGFMHDVLLSLVRNAFGQLDLTAGEVLREMDSDGRSVTSFLGLFVQELRAGDCRRAAMAELGQKLAEHRAEDVQTPGSGFTAMALRDEQAQAVERFLADLQADGSSMRKGLFGAIAQVEARHQLAYGQLWTHMPQAVATDRLSVTHLNVVPDPDRLQMEAVRVDATPPVLPVRLTCFTESTVPTGRPAHTYADSDFGLV